jgi:glycerophosphoryl diester phosphodiesterase
MEAAHERMPNATSAERMLIPHFELQGHRGARGLKPENTLPSFEAALDLCVTSIETDLHRTRDGVPVTFHDPSINPNICRLTDHSTSPDPGQRPLIGDLTLAQLRGYRADRNPGLRRFPKQDATPTPLAVRFAAEHGFDPFTVPTLADFFAFVEAYAGEPGKQAGKTPAQQAAARRLVFDLELKHVPFRAAHSTDRHEGRDASLLENSVLEAIRAANALGRTRVRSFDHRVVRLLHQLEPRLETAIIIAGTAPISPSELTRAAGAEVYGPDFEFLDWDLVLQAHREGIRVVPWTVNQPEDWARLLDWGVDGITTDFPDQLAAFLMERHVRF